MKTPYPHQIEAAEYLLKDHLEPKYLFMEPRTGKTLSTILALKAIDEEALILAPKSVLPVWRDELIEAGVPENEVFIIEGTPAKKKKMLAECRGYHIMTYETSWRLIQNIYRYAAIVFDEAIKLQNHSSKVGKFWRAIRKEGDPTRTRFWALSGAPCPESPLQLANQMFVLHGRWFDQTIIERYRWEYWNYNERKYKYEPKDPRHAIQAVDEFVARAFVVSQSDLNMGDKLFEVRRVQASTAEEKMLARAKEKVAREAAEKKQEFDYRVWANYAQAVASGIDPEEKLILLTNPTKLRAIQEAVGEMLELDPLCQVVVMCRYIVTGDWLSRHLKAPFIHGNVSGAERDHIVKQYQSGAKRVIVAQAESVKMGLDFSAGGNGLLIYAEHPWSGDCFIQSTQRVVNIQRKTPAQIITYCTQFKDLDVDYNIYQAVSNKLDFNANMLKKGSPDDGTN